jgi:hypothetical protein
LCLFPGPHGRAGIVPTYTISASWQRDQPSFSKKPFLASALERKVEGLLNRHTAMSRDRIKPQRA